MTPVNDLVPLRMARCLPETVICLQRTVGGGRTVRVVLTVDGRSRRFVKDTSRVCHCSLSIRGVFTVIANKVSG